MGKSAKGMADDVGNRANWRERSAFSTGAGAGRFKRGPEKGSEKGDGAKEGGSGQKNKHKEVN